MDSITCLTNLKTIFNNTSLMEQCVTIFNSACSNDDLFTVSTLMAFGMSNVVICKGFYSACMNNESKVAEYLSVEHFSKKPEELKKCFDEAYKCHYNHVTTWLKNNIGKFECENSYALFSVVCFFGKFDVAEELLKKSTNVCNKDGKIPALITYCHCGTTILDLLLKYNVDIKLSLNSALERATMFTYTDYTKRLIDYGADISILPISQLFLCGYIDQLEKLITNDNCYDIFAEACEMGVVDIMEFIYAKFFNSDKNILKTVSAINRSKYVFGKFAPASLDWIISKDYKFFVENYSGKLRGRLPQLKTIINLHLFNVAFDDKPLKLSKCVDDLDAISFHALCYKNKIVVLMILQNRYPHIRFSVNELGQVVDYSLYPTSIKSARKI